MGNNASLKIQSLLHKKEEKKEEKKEHVAVVKQKAYDPAIGRVVEIEPAPVRDKPYSRYRRFQIRMQELRHKRFLPESISVKFEEIWLRYHNWKRRWFRNIPFPQPKHWPSYLAKPPATPWPSEVYHDRVSMPIQIKAGSQGGFRRRYDSPDGPSWIGIADDEFFTRLVKIDDEIEAGGSLPLDILLADMGEGLDLEHLSMCLLKEDTVHGYEACAPLRDRQQRHRMRYPIPGHLVHTIKPDNHALDLFAHRPSNVSNEEYPVMFQQSFRELFDQTEQDYVQIKKADPNKPILIGMNKEEPITWPIHGHFGPEITKITDLYNRDVDPNFKEMADAVHKSAMEKELAKGKTPSSTPELRPIHYSFKQYYNDDMYENKHP
eukprot:TRINITY_DN5903_c0_g1_i1.p1 TRINITY_DN5903_c0_g1~~TRINITY_DN5903_c0_g1_i1.p1  ORF type:complete len:378 (-),score=51.06 TRINITY_DN5903_c0_g1_i1:122-1255(-)